MARARVWGVVLAGFAVAGALQGCASPSPYPSFDAPAEADDVLPPELIGLIDGEVDQGDGDVRFVADHEGYDIYLVRPGGGSSCIGIADGENSFFSCGGSDGRVTVNAPAVGAFEVGPAPIGKLDGWTVLSDNVRVKNQ